MFVHNAGIAIHYESAGQGPPVLLVMGLGMAATGWWRTTRVLSPAMRVLSFDNRGAGRSEAPPGPYTLAEMASDAIAVLDAEGIQRAHVCGFSLGGMVAQELALRYPERVARLVLGASTAGGPGATPPDAITLGFLERRLAMPVEEAAWASVPYLYGTTTRRHHGGRIGQDIVQRLRFPIEPEPYRAQLAAAGDHDAAARLFELQAPTLVVHGSEDRLVPPENGRRLAELIPHAELEMVEEAGHLYATDEPKADRRILRFLLERPVNREGRGSRRRRSEREAPA